MIQNSSSKKIERNIGLEILRMILCFWVLLFHSISNSKNFVLNFILKKKFHVPCFFFISFYYFFPIIKNRNTNKMRIRMERLFVPFLIWPLFIWFFNNILYLIIKGNRFRRMLTFNELFIQIITGRKFFIQLWFIFNIIFISIFFFIISFINDNVLIIIINILSLLCYLIQLNEKSYIFYTDFTDCIAHSVGHLIISFPIAITAFLSNKFNLIYYFENIKTKLLFFIIFFIALLLLITGKSDTYSGIDKNLFSLLIFYFVQLIPLNKYLNKNSKNIIYFLTSYTNGIYCLHIIIKYYIFKIFKVKITVLSCILLYYICYIFSFVGKKLFGKSNLKYLFI